MSSRDTSNAPELISNGAAVRLNKAGWGQQYLKEFRSFDLRSGSVDVVVPDVEPGNDYSITRTSLRHRVPPFPWLTCLCTVFGDSGNLSEEFSIVKADA